jgi:hypothetical protein
MNFADAEGDDLNESEQLFLQAVRASCPRARNACEVRLARLGWTQAEIDAADEQSGKAFNKRFHAAIPALLMELQSDHDAGFGDTWPKTVEAWCVWEALEVADVLHKRAQNREMRKQRKRRRHDEG